MTSTHSSKATSADVRSSVFWSRLAEEPALWASLSNDDQRAIGESLRDLFFALSSHARDRDRGRDEEGLFRAVVDAIDPEPTLLIDGLGVSFYPTTRFKSLRFLDVEHIDPTLRSLFAHPSTEAPYLAAAFVDPNEYSFRTFENIIPLDRYFGASAVEVELKDRVKLGTNEGRYSFTIDAPEATRAALLRLDDLGLYMPPLNAGSRGGERYIFHSAVLSEALTASIKKAMPKSLLKNFSHVNPVFRCNRFKPGDKKFESHLDTPYYDSSRQQVSRYTVLLYLTGGRGTNVLRLADEVSLDSIAPMTCVLFDQSLEHEGAAFDEGDKIFLRTELVFTDASVEHAPGIAEMFSKACYMTGESLYAPELERIANNYYNRVSAAHWGEIGAVGSSSEITPEPFVHKKFRELHFVANGYDFWFPKSAASLEECAAVALLDYLNCKLGNKAFRSLCTSSVVRKHGKAIDWVPSFLAPFNTPRTDCVFSTLDKEGLFPEVEAPDGTCCPFHADEHFDASRCEEISDLYGRAQKFAQRRVSPAPILAMGQEIFLDASRFVVTENQIHVLSERALSPVNFAACWNYGGSPPSYLAVETTVRVLDLLVPPILFTETDGCYHLMLDIFRNSWMVNQTTKNIPIPKIDPLLPVDEDEDVYDEDDEEDEEDDTDHENTSEGENEEAASTQGKRWLRAVETTIVKAPSGKSGVDKIWWASDTPLLRELFAKTPKPKS